MNPALVVVEPGLFSTIQDAGRPGYARLGVSAAGAADPVALRLANRLAGNDEDAPAIEMTLRGGLFRPEADVVVALGGADMQARLDGVPLPPWTAVRAPAGSTLRCGAARSGARAILAVGGGLDVTPVLGSASTHARSGLGGLEGRPLRAGDRLPLARRGGGPAPPAGLPRPPRRLAAGTLARLAPPPALRVTIGAQWDGFPEAARRTFLGSIYAVGAASDRMGLRLDGPPLDPPGGGRMITEGMPLGAVQVPPDGRPVILFVDHQTTGGYPVIASVISADLAHLGQMRPGDPARFALVTLDAAHALVLEQEACVAHPEIEPA